MGRLLRWPVRYRRARASHASRFAMARRLSVQYGRWQDIGSGPLSRKQQRVIPTARRWYLVDRRGFAVNRNGRRGPIYARFAAREKLLSCRGEERLLSVKSALRC